VFGTKQHTQYDVGMVSLVGALTIGQRDEPAFPEYPRQNPTETDAAYMERYAKYAAELDLYYEGEDENDDWDMSGDLDSTIDTDSYVRIKKLYAESIKK